jgi:hypothetical protein
MFEKKVFVCQYCGKEMDDYEMMVLHESCCPSNPENQPCSECAHCIINVSQCTSKCAKNVRMETIDNEKIFCFCYEHGKPTLDTSSLWDLLQQSIKLGSIQQDAPVDPRLYAQTPEELINEFNNVTAFNTQTVEDSNQQGEDKKDDE